jgi:nucleoside-diphosphate-sugar epimerase
LRNAWVGSGYGRAAGWLDAPCGGLVEAKGEYPHCPLYLQILFDWVANGSAIPVLGRGDNRYQFVHADDLADACMRAAARPGFAIYHVGTDRFGTMRETLEALCAHAGTGSRVISVPKGLAVAAMQAPSWLGLSPLGPISLAHVRREPVVRHRARQGGARLAATADPKKAIIAVAASLQPL